MVYHSIHFENVQNFLKLAGGLSLTSGVVLGVPDPKYHFLGLIVISKILHQFLPGLLKKHKKGHIVATLMIGCPTTVEGRSQQRALFQKVDKVTEY